MDQIRQGSRDLDQAMTKEDFYMLLDAYKNMIKLNTTLLDQQSRLLEQHNQILEKQNVVSQDVNKVFEEIGTHTKDVGSLHKDISKSVTDIKLKQSDCRADCGQDFSKISNKVYIGWIGMGVIITSLLALLINSWSKLDLIKAIAINLGVG